MFIPRQEYRELIEEVNYYKQLAKSWQEQAEKGLKVAQEIATTRDKFQKLYEEEKAKGEKENGSVNNDIFTYS